MLYGLPYYEAVCGISGFFAPLLLPSLCGHTLTVFFCSNSMTENEIASFVRKALTAEWPDCTWQVLVGRNFGSYVQFEESRYIYFYIAQVRHRV